MSELNLTLENAVQTILQTEHISPEQISLLQDHLQHVINLERLQLIQAKHAELQDKSDGAPVRDLMNDLKYRLAHWEISGKVKDLDQDEKQRYMKTVPRNYRRLEATKDGFDVTTLSPAHLHLLPVVAYAIGPLPLKKYTVLCDRLQESSIDYVGTGREIWAVLKRSLKRDPFLNRLTARALRSGVVEEHHAVHQDRSPHVQPTTYTPIVQIDPTTSQREAGFLGYVDYTQPVGYIESAPVTLFDIHNWSSVPSESYAHESPALEFNR